jgi:hypothetical protein
MVGLRMARYLGAGWTTITHGPVKRFTGCGVEKVVRMTGVRAQQVSRRRASGADNARPERVKVLALARAHEIDAILVSQLSRWGRRSTRLES